MNISFAVGRFEARALAVGGSQQALRWFAILLATLVLAACGGGGGGGAAVTQPSLAITQQPADQRVVTGSSATFRVAANGAASFQWQRLGADSQWTDIAGATQAELVLSGLTEADSGRQYRAQVKSGAMVLTSSAVTLSVTPPVPAGVAVQPSDAQSRVGQAPSFSVTASGTNLSYQWQSSPDGLAWTDVAGATTETLTLPTATLADSGRLYRVVVRNSLATVTSRAVTLSVLPALAKPLFTAQPQDRSVVAGDSTTFTATASGEPVPTLQWETSLDGQSWLPVGGATTSTLTVNAIAQADNGRRYRAVATNGQGSETSAVARLTVIAPVAPSFVRQPQAMTVNLAQAAAFEVEATGTPTPTLQWQVSLDDGKTFTNINGATGTRLELATTVAADDGKLFRVVADNRLWSMLSATAKLTVQTAPEVTLHPKDVVSGISQSDVTLTAAASGKPAPSVQWQASRDDGVTWQDISGATAASYTWAPSRADDLQLLRAKFSNVVGSTYSNAARIRKARWVAVSPSFVGSSLLAVRWLDDKVAVAVGHLGAIVRTADGGASWQFAQEPMAGRPRYSQLAVLDARTVLAAGDNGTLMRSEDAGLTWRSIAIPTTGWVYALTFRNASIGVMSAKNGGFRSVDGGLTWTPIPSADPARPFEKLSGMALRGQQGFAIGEDNWFRSSDGGATWKAVDLPQSFLYLVPLTSTEVVYLDDQTLMSSGRKFARSTDGGLTWQEMPAVPGTNSTPYQLRFTPDGKIGFDTWGNVRSVDGGKTWTKRSSPHMLNDVAFSPSGLALGVNSHGEIRQSSDLADTWSKPYGSQGLDGVQFWAIEFPDNDSRGIAFGNVANKMSLFQTTDGGLHWQPLQQFNVNSIYNPSSVSFADAQVGMVAQSNGPLLRTTDGGRSWTQLAAPPISSDNGLSGGNSVLAMVDRNTAVMIAEDGAWRTADGGSSWTRTLAVSYPHNLGLYAVAARGNRVLAVANDGHVHRSLDGGKTWSATTYPDTRGIYIAWASDSTVFILDALGALNRSDDAGQTWRRVRTQPVPMENFFTIRFAADGQTGVMASHAAVYRSSDGGETWNRDVDFLVEGFWLTSGFSNSRQPVLVGGDGRVFVGNGY